MGENLIFLVLTLLAVIWCANCKEDATSLPRRELLPVKQLVNGTEKNNPTESINATSIVAPENDKANTNISSEVGKDTGSLPSVKTVYDGGRAHSKFHSVSVKLLVGEKDHISVALPSSTDRYPYLLEMKKGFVHSIDYHWAKNIVFFSANNSIFRANVTGHYSLSEPEVVIDKGVDSAVSLSVDWVNDKLYWMVDKYQTIEMSDLDGKHRTLLFDNIKPFKWPNNIVVDPYNKSIFFVSNYVVFTSSLDGGQVKQVLIDQTKFGDPSRGIRHIALDRYSQKLYVTGRTKMLDGNGTVAFIDYSDYDGGDSQMLIDVSRTEWKDVFAMDVLGDSLYFAHYNRKCPDELFEVEKTNTNFKPIKRFVPKLCSGGIWSIKVFHPCAQLPSNDVTCFIHKSTS